MEMQDFIPAAGIPYLIAAFTTVRFENQRLVRFFRDRNAAEVLVGLFVALTGFAGLLVGLGLLVYLLIYAGWQIAVGAAAISFVSGLLISTTLGLVLKGDSLLVGWLSTFAIWPIGYFLVQAVLAQY